MGKCYRSYISRYSAISGGVGVFLDFAAPSKKGLSSEPDFVGNLRSTIHSLTIILQFPIQKLCFAKPEAPIFRFVLDT